MLKILMLISQRQLSSCICYGNRQLGGEESIPQGPLTRRGLQHETPMVRAVQKALLCARGRLAL